MRVLNGAQTTLCYLGVLAGYEHTSDGMSDPLLVHFVRRMLLEETLPTLEPVPGVSAERYVEQSLDRLETPRSATATTRSPPTARRRSSNGC